VNLTQAGRPVLVGTTSVEISELVSRMLQMRKIKHNVLNAKQHQREAEIVAFAGQPGTVTIATNMAGRGTDIKLTPENELPAVWPLSVQSVTNQDVLTVSCAVVPVVRAIPDLHSSMFHSKITSCVCSCPSASPGSWTELGLKEGEVIQHSMVTSSIERAQKKVEENNFGIRKRLLEYDNVMNSQREVIYKRRKNALYGERLELDILTMMYDLSEEIVNSAKNSEDYDSMRLNALSTLGVDFEITEEEFRKGNTDQLKETLYEKALAHYHQKNKMVAEKALPVIRDIYKTRGATVENILVPFTDGVKTIGVGADLKKSVDTNNVELIKAMEKNIALAIIDQLWKEHLREMDDLKQSVQTAVYEQKDPLLIYKFEGFELFKRLVGKVNEETITFLMKADIPVQKADQVEEARAQRTATRYKEQKDESQSLLNSGGGGGQQQPHQTGRPPQEKVMPAKSEKIANRNDKVNVQYTDGRVLKDVKYKKVEDDILNNRCIVID
jgi:preprotein translocase subunit SecA